MKKQIPLSALIKLIGFYSLIIGIIGAILVFGIALTKQQSNPTPTPTITVTPTIASSPIDNKNGEGQFCGGSKDVQCPAGYVCVFEGGKYLEKGGKCVKQHPRQPAKEGEFCGGIAAIQCIKDYTCKLSGNYPDAGGICVKM